MLGKLLMTGWERNTMAINQLQGYPVVLGSLPEQKNSGVGTPYRPAMARQSRGYGFVRFGGESDQQRALVEMQGVYCGNRPMRISTATPKTW